MPGQGQHYWQAFAATSVGLLVCNSETQYLRNLRTAKLTDSRTLEGTMQVVAVLAKRGRRQDHNLHESGWRHRRASRTLVVDVALRCRVMWSAKPSRRVGRSIRLRDGHRRHPAWPACVTRPRPRRYDVVPSSTPRQP